MKKTLAILLSLALLITAIPFATASANTYTTAADLAVATNWTPVSYASCNQIDNGVQIKAYFTVWAGIFTTMTLKANTTYTITANFTTTDATNIVDGSNGVIVVPNYTAAEAASVDWPKVLAPVSIGSGYTHNGKSSGTMTVTFTTTDDTQYVLGIRDKGSTYGNPCVNLTNFALTEHVPPTNLENATEAIATKFTGTQYASIRAKDEAAGKAQGLRVRSDIDTSVLGDAALEDCTVVEYGTLVAKTENLGGAAMTIDMVGTEKKVVKGVAYNTSGTDVVYKLDGTTKSFTLVLINIPVERFVTSYSYRAYAIIEDAEGNQATVYGGATVPVSVESVATDIVNSGTATAEDKAAAQTALDEYAAYEATLPTYTTAADLADAANWTAGGNTTLSQIDNGVQMQAWYTVYASLFTTLNLKANTTYTITASFEGDCSTTLLDNAYGVIVVPASAYTQTTAASADWPSILTPATIGSGYTHNGKNSGTMTVTFTTTDETQYTLGVRDSGRGSNVTWECNPLVKFTNFAITEN